MNHVPTVHVKFHPERDAVALAACRGSLGGLIEKIVRVADCVELHTRYKHLASEMTRVREHYRKLEK